MKRRDYEELQRLVAKFNEHLVLVEGKKDAAALKQLGFKNVHTLKGKALFSVVEEIAFQTKECLVLTDLDAKGKQLYAKITKDLAKHGVHVNNELRNFLFKHTGVRQIEGLFSFLRSQDF